MTLPRLLGAVLALNLIAGCNTDFAAAIQRRCAGTADPAACEKGEWAKYHAEQRARARRIGGDW